MEAYFEYNGRCLVTGFLLVSKDYCGTRNKTNYRKRKATAQRKLLEKQAQLKKKA